MTLATLLAAWEAMRSLEASEDSAPSIAAVERDAAQLERPREADAPVPAPERRCRPPKVRRRERL